MEFIASCNDLKVFGAEYFHNICTELHKELYSHTNYKMLEPKEKRARNDMALATEKSEKEIKELMKRLDDTAEEKMLATEQINRLKEKQESEMQRIREEIERTAEEKRLAAEEINQLKEKQEVEMVKMREQVERQAQMIKDMQEQEKERLDEITRQREKNKFNLLSKVPWEYITEYITEECSIM